MAKTLPRFGCWIATAACLALAVIESGQTAAQLSITLNTQQSRSIGGVSTLDRAQFFNIAGTLVPPSNTNAGNLRLETYAESGLNLTPGRIATEFDQFISENLPADPTRPEFVNPTSLRNRLQGDYRNFVVNGSRHESLRQSTTNPIVVNSGRASTFFPSYMRTGEQSNLFPDRDAYAEFLNIYLDEAVFGANAFYPVDPDRFHVEIINEPDLHIAGAFSGSNTTLFNSSTELAEYHRDIADAVKAVHPNVSIGGPSLALTNFSGSGYRSWENTLVPFIDVAGGSVDFYSFHPYERYNVQNDGSFIRQVDQSPGRVNVQLDMVVNQQELSHGNRLPIAVTEYSSFNQANSSGSYGNYARDEQQWDLSRDFREQLLIYINRPDIILNATPFVAPRSFLPDVPTAESADNVLFEQDSDGNWSESFVGNTFRIYSQVKGDYLNVGGANGDVQTAAFRDDDTVYLMLNNLLDISQAIDLDVITSALGSVSSATISRVFRDLSGNQFIDGLDITGSFGNLVLNPNEGAVLTLMLDNADAINDLVSEETYYGDRIATPLDIPFGRSQEIQIDAETTNAIAAKLRIGYSRGNTPEAFALLVNGNLIQVPAGDLGIDDDDSGLFAREVDVPIQFLTDGVNVVQADFTGDGGTLSSAALRVFSGNSVIPEPSSSVLVTAAMAVAGLRRRRDDQPR